MESQIRFDVHFSFVGRAILFENMLISIIFIVVSEATEQTPLSSVSTEREGQLPSE